MGAWSTYVTIDRLVHYIDWFDDSEVSAVCGAWTNLVGSARVAARNETHATCIPCIAYEAADTPRSERG